MVKCVYITSLPETKMLKSSYLKKKNEENAISSSQALKVICLFEYLNPNVEILIYCVL